MLILQYRCATWHKYIYMVWIQTNANPPVTRTILIFEVCCLNKKWSCMCEEQVLLNRFYPENPLCSTRPDRRQSSAAPPPGQRMAWVRVFVADLARARKSFAEIKKTVDAAYRDRSLSPLQIYRIIKQARAGKDAEDQRHLNPKKTFAQRISSPPWPPP